MAKAGYCISPRNINPIPIPFSTEPNSLNFLYTTTTTTTRTLKLRAALKKNDFSMITKKGQPSKQRLIRISTSEGKWLGSWNTEYIFSLRELQLQDLAEGEDREALVSIKLCIQKHAGFGLSVDGTINFSLTRKCRNCSSPYCRQIDTDFNVWVLPLHRRSNDPDQLPEIGDDDPSLSLQNLPLYTEKVIYVKPGCEVDLDSVIRDTIRLTASVNEACSDLCKKSKPRLHYIGKQNVPSLDKRWSKLLELKKSYR